MVDIQSRILIDRMAEETKIQPILALPRKFGETIQPVIDIKQQGKIKSIVQTGNFIDHELVVPTGKRWKVLFGRISVNASAVAGNRLFRLTIWGNGINTRLWEVRATNVQVANNIEDYMFGGMIPNPTEDVAGKHFLPFPNELWLDQGDALRVDDNANIDAGDTANFNVMVLEFDK